jgi:hypothetical protein
MSVPEQFRCYIPESGYGMKLIGRIRTGKDHLSPFAEAPLRLLIAGQLSGSKSRHYQLNLAALRNFGE